MNDQQKQQIIEQIKSAKHVLVTVSANPTVDELAASIGLTLAINKMDKHATTVFSGHVPSTIEFLQPENTIETTTDSLRDFIIALDKSKADKLRYKVEDDVVRIFITPYRTTITDKDLDFSQGDFNVDLVIGLGVTNRQDLDTAITAHGRILHDATIVSLTKRDAVSELGSINWQDAEASSLCEMTASIITTIQPEVIDGQMATAFLTGIIAETDRFKNEKTTPIALSLSSQLMSAGANQQLIAEKLDEPEPAPVVHSDEFSVGESQTPQQRPDGELEIDHSEDKIDKIHIDDHGNLQSAELAQDDNDQQYSEQSEPQFQDQQQYQEQTSFTPDGNSDSYSDENDEILPPLPPQPEIPEILHRPTKMLDDSENRDPGKDLFDDLATQESNDSEEKPTLDQPESSDTPMMEHQRIVMPPAHPDDLPKSDKPFDPQEAMQAMGVMQQTLPSAPSVLEAPVPGPVIEVPEAQPSGDSLADLEKAVGSPHVTSSPVVDQDSSQLPPPDLNSARDSVIQASNSVPPMFPEPSQSIGAHPISLEPPKVDTGEVQVKSNDPNAPPPVPPPMTPQFYDADGNNANPFVNPHN